MNAKARNAAIHQSTKKEAETKKAATGRYTAFPTRYKLAFLLGVIAFLVYANTLSNGYAVDDASVITDNKIVTRGISAIPEILFTPYRKGINLAANDQYRPLSLVMFAVEYQVFGLNPMPGHLVNVLLFGCCVVLLFLFFDDFFERKRTPVAFITALLFALHPIHTEVVANIKSRDELLCFFFVFLGCIEFLNYAKSGKWQQLSIGALCYFLSIMSKETSFTFLVIIPFVFFFYANSNRNRSLYILACVGVAAIVALALRYSVLHYQTTDASQIPFIDNELAKQGLPAESRFATALLILGYYLRLLLVPYPLMWDYSFNIIPLTHFSDMRVLMSLAIYVFLIAFSLYRLSRRKKDALAFGILFYLVTIALFSNILFLIGAAMGERFLFFPSVGFCLVVALAVEKWLSKPGATVSQVFENPKALAVIAVIGLAYIVLTVRRNAEWVDNYTLYKSDVEKAPNGAKLNYFTGYELATSIVRQEKEPEKVKEDLRVAVDYFRKALAIYPDYDKAEANLAYAYFCLGLYDSSETHGRKAVLLGPDNAFALSNLAAVYNYKKDYPRAIALYKDAIRVNPEDVSSYAYAGLSYGSLGKYDSAIWYCNQAIAVDPDFNASYEILATTYKIIGKADSAGKYAAILQSRKR